MWRYRHHFIDVVWFEAARSAMPVYFACTPRASDMVNPKPWECHFSVQPQIDLGVDQRLLAFAADSPHQRKAFAQLALELEGAARRWFSKFESIESALRALRSNTIRCESHIFNAAPGSAAYASAMAELELLKQQAA